MSRQIVRIVLAACVSAIASVIALRGADLAGLRHAMAGASLVWLLPYPVICVVLNVLRGAIWRRLLDRRVKTVPAFWAYCVGFLANNVLPFRVGEGVRVVVLAVRRGLPIVEVATAAGLERLLDLMALALMLGLIAISLDNIPGLTHGAAFVVTIVAGGLGLIAAIVRFRAASDNAIARLASWAPDRLRQSLIKRWGELVHGLAVLLKPSVGVPTGLGAVIVWTLTAVLQWLVLLAFQPRAGFIDAAFMVVAISLAIALPAAPGFVGVYHLAGQQALVAAFPERYDASTALAIATVAHAISYLTSTALGVVGLWYFGLAPSAVVSMRPSVLEGVSRG